MNLISQLRSSFFGLSLDPKNAIDFRTAVLKEMYFLIKHLGMNYDELQSMPIYKRKFFINEFVNEKMNENASKDVSKKEEGFKAASAKINQILASRSEN